MKSRINNLETCIQIVEAINMYEYWCRCNEDVLNQHVLGNFTGFLNIDNLKHKIEIQKKVIQRLKERYNKYHKLTKLT